MSEAASSGLFPLQYSVYAGRPRIDLSFEVGAGGACTVGVFTEESLDQRPPIRFGHFAAALPGAVLERLIRWAAVAEAPGEGAIRPFDSVSRFLGKGGGAPRPVLAESGGLRPPDEDLADAAKAALSNPLSAIEVAAEAKEAGPPRLVIASIGQQPFPLVLFEHANANMRAQIWRLDRTAPEGAVFLAEDALAELARSGVIGDGVIDLAPGQTVSLPLPGGETAGNGGFSFWRAGKGPERRSLTGTWSLADA